MPKWIPQAGDTFLATAGVDSMHLYVVLNDPASFSDYGYGSYLYIAAVNFTTLHSNAHHDPACIVNAGEHPFVTRDSYVRYRDAKFERVDKLKLRVESGEWPLKEPVSAELLTRLRQGLQASKFAAREYKKLLHDLI